MKRALITGGASGLGLGCARRFAGLGYDITLADVDEAAGRRAQAELAANQRGGVRFEPVDLADPASVAALAQRVLARRAPLDVLVNNAGIYPPSRRAVNAEGQELTFAIAHLGHFRLTHALWPLLEAAPAARVISVSSLVQRRSRIDLDNLTLARDYEPIRAYGQAKLACLMFALELQRRLGSVRSRMASYAVHPGVCRTQLADHRRRSPGDTVWQRFASRALAFGLRHYGQTPDEGARAVLEAATTSGFPPGSFLGPTGFLEAAGPIGTIRLGPAAADSMLGQKLWWATERITQLRWPI